MPMPWEAEYTDEFGQWWQELSEGRQDDVDAKIELLMEHGPDLPYPYSSDIRGPRHGVMRESFERRAAAAPGTRLVQRPPREGIRQAHARPQDIPLSHRGPQPQ